jgi:hypothetical protein
MAVSDPITTYIFRRDLKHLSEIYRNENGVKKGRCFLNLQKKFNIALYPDLKMESYIQFGKVRNTENKKGKNK